MIRLIIFCTLALCVLNGCSQLKYNKTKYLLSEDQNKPKEKNEDSKMVQESVSEKTPESPIVFPHTYEEEDLKKTLLNWMRWE